MQEGTVERRQREVCLFDHIQYMMFTLTMKNLVHHFPVYILRFLTICCRCVLISPHLGHDVQYKQRMIRNLDQVFTAWFLSDHIQVTHLQLST